MFRSVGKAAQAESDDDGEVFGIYLVKAFQRRGLGRRLFIESCTALRQAGFKTLRLSVLKDNPSVAFYAALGGTIAETKEVSISGKSLTMLVYHWDDIDTICEKESFKDLLSAMPAVGDDADFERTPPTHRCR